MYKSLKKAKLTIFYFKVHNNQHYKNIYCKGYTLKKKKSCIIFIGILFIIQFKHLIQNGIIYYNKDHNFV